MPIVTSYGGKILVMAKAPAGKEITVIDLPELTTDRLVQVLVGSGDVPGGWTAAYFINYLDDTERNRRWPEWTGAIDNLGPELWSLFGAKLDKALKERGLKSGTRLVWLPSGWLGMLPLGLAQDPASKRRLADDYVISYAPSIEALAAAHRAVAKATPATLAVVINPTGDLPGSEKEGAIVASHFAADARTVLRAAELPRPTPFSPASRARRTGTSPRMAPSHGPTRASPPCSCTGLRGSASAGSSILTDWAIRAWSSFRPAKPGLSEITSNPDEFIGLPGTFTALGAAGVLGTLWPVNDAATALLMAKFYELHIGAGLAPPVALNQAQAWLRQATSDDLNAYAKTASGQGRLESRHVTEIAEELSAEGHGPLAQQRDRQMVHEK